MELKIVRISQEQVGLLRRWFEKLDEVTSFESDVELASKITNYGIFREVGTVNDELARFIFDVETAKSIRLES